MLQDFFNGLFGPQGCCIRKGRAPAPTPGSGHPAQAQALHKCNEKWCLRIAIRKPSRPAQQAMKIQAQTGAGLTPPFNATQRFVITELSELREPSLCEHFQK